MTLCKYAGNCGIAKFYSEKIKKSVDPVEKRKTEIEYLAKCEDNSFTCSEKRDFEGNLIVNLKENSVWQH